jgi:hypothetical protein
MGRVSPQPRHRVQLLNPVVKPPLPITEFELEVLERVAQDYESISTIVGDLARDLQRPVLEEEVGEVLLELVRQGLIDAFVYDASASGYKQTVADAPNVAALWFLINARGRAVCENAA